MEMEMETETSSASIGEPVTVTAAAHVIRAEDDTMRDLNDAVKSLPSKVIKELLSLKVCSRCILRLLGIRDRHYYCLSQSTLQSVVVLEQEVEPLCTICLGVLQFTYRNDSGTLLKKDSTDDDLALSIADFVKHDGHHIDHFSLEVSLPPIILENEQLVWLYLKKKYESELWFQQKPLTGFFSAKDALKSDVKYDLNSFRIRLTYSATNVSKRGSHSEERNGDFKRKKSDNNGSLDNVKNEVVTADTFNSSVSDTITGKSSNGLEDHKSSECLKLPLEKVDEPLLLVVSCNRTPIFLAGRYLKYSRHVSQSRWIIDDERMGEASVEEIIGGCVLPLCRGDSYKFHAAGREDIDVRMLGSGRPFLIEIQNARQIPSEVLVKEMENKINSSEKKLVRIKNLKAVGSEGWAIISEGEAEKQKQYAALVWVSRPLEDNDVQSITSLIDLQITQRTPIRVLHRRSPLDREKTIHWMKIERIADSSQYFLLQLCTQAGTYIKEFVHGDLGRTNPSIGSILGCRAEILQLDVTDVKMDSIVG
ncbi:hypothetical protein ACFE04_015993 [Oxalis oulophora]